MNLHFNATQDVGHGITIIFMCFVIIVIAVLFDLYTGIKAAKKTGEPIRSHILRKTINKITDYYIAVGFGILIDWLGLCFPWYGIPYATIITTFAVIIIEGRSVLENLEKSKSSAAKVDDVVDSALPILQEMIDCKTLKTAVKLYDKIRNGEEDDDKK